MRILITGNLGYIGSVMSNIVLNQGHEVIGYDIGYFKDCLTSEDIPVSKQINKDLRKLEESDLENIDCVIHLASLSNDPLGAFMPELTEEINYHATIKLAEIAKKKSKAIYICIISKYLWCFKNRQRIR